MIPKIIVVKLVRKKKSFDSYSKKPLKEEVGKAMRRYYKQLENSKPVGVYELVLKEIEPPLLISTMQYTKNNQSEAAKILCLNRTTLRTKLKKYNLI